MDEESKLMLEDACQAVTVTNMWDYMKKPSTPGENGFMSSSDPELVEIKYNMNYLKYTGLCRSWALTNTSYIARYGFEAFVDHWNRNI
jgi:hypothetical protein